MVARLQENGSLINLPPTDRPRSACPDENIERVRARVEEELEASTRRRSRELRMSRTSLRRIKKELKIFPYKTQLVHELRPMNHELHRNDAIPHLRNSQRK